jgi:hypothetical protein
LCKALGAFCFYWILDDRVATGIFDVADGKFHMMLDPQIARIKDIDI